MRPPSAYGHFIPEKWKSEPNFRTQFSLTPKASSKRIGEYFARRASFRRGGDIVRVEYIAFQGAIDIFMDKLLLRLIAVLDYQLFRKCLTLLSATCLLEAVYYSQVNADPADKTETTFQITTEEQTTYYRLYYLNAETFLLRADRQLKGLDSIAYDNSVQIYCRSGNIYWLYDGRQEPVLLEAHPSGKCTNSLYNIQVSGITSRVMLNALPASYILNSGLPWIDAHSTSTNEAGRIEAHGKYGDYKLIWETHTESESRTSITTVTQIKNASEFKYEITAESLTHQFPHFTTLRRWLYEGQSRSLVSTLQVLDSRKLKDDRSIFDPKMQHLRGVNQHAIYRDCVTALDTYQPETERLIRIAGQLITIGRIRSVAYVSFLCLTALFLGFILHKLRQKSTTKDNDEKQI